MNLAHWLIAGMERGNFVARELYLWTRAPYRSLFRPKAVTPVNIRSEPGRHHRAVRHHSLRILSFALGMPFSTTCQRPW
jgi:hypothetical protein